MAQHDNYVIKKDTLTGIAGEVKTLAGVSGDITLEQMKNNISQANTDVSTQADLIAQIKTALEGKAAGGGGTEKIETLIDQSGVLDRTEGTVEDKVEQLVEKAEVEKFLRENSNSFNFSGRKNFTETPILDCSSLTSLLSTFQQTDVERVYLKNTQNVADWRYAFNNASVLVTLEILDFSSAKSLPSNIITSDLLENFKLVPNTAKVSFAITSKRLTPESKQSIFDGLATVETAQTLTLHKDAKILQSQVDSANAKGWTVAGGTVVSEEEYYG